MKPLLRLQFIVCILFLTSASAQKNIEITSPNGHIAFSFKMHGKSALYSIAYKGETIIDYSGLSLNFEDDTFGNNLKLYKPVFRDTTENYELIVGKTQHVYEHYKEVTIPLEEMVSPFRKINIVVRIFDDGLALRYEFPQQHNWPSFTLIDENTTFKLTGNPIVRTLFFPDYTSAHEGIYQTLLLHEVKEDTLMDMPALFEFPQHIFLAITEAELIDYAGMYLSKHDGALISKLSPWPNQTVVKVKANLPHQTPWRVLIISDRIGALIESNIITSLNEPCKIKDVSWLKPGKTMFPWWNGNVVPDTLNAPGNNFVTNKYYIDFCADILLLNMVCTNGMLMMGLDFNRGRIPMLQHLFRVLICNRFAITQNKKVLV